MTSSHKIYFNFVILFSLATTLLSQPNFVVILTDDMGWTGTSVQMDTGIAGSQSDFYLTPALEALAQSGMTFSQAYAPAPKCSPSRCSILTGRTTARNQFTETGNGVTPNQILLAPLTNTAINGADTTLAEWLKSTNLNYRTAHLGKWHQGNTAASSPGSNGFDFSDGSTNNGSGNNGGLVQADPKNIFDLTNRATSFIQDAVTDEVPFYLQLSHYAVHTDIEARQATIDLYNDASQRPPGTIHTGPEYGAMTEDTDTGIGQLVDFISNLGLDTNTYIIFTSDNGGQQNVTSNTPLNRGKSWIYEGGIRVPFIVKGPGVLADTYSTKPVVAYDLFPTIAGLTGSSVPLPSNLDGTDISPLLRGEEIARTESLYFHSPHYSTSGNKHPRSAAIDGKYKLIVDYDTGAMDLYDLENDIGESSDLSNALPDIAAYLKVKLRDHLKSSNANMPTLDPSHPNFAGTAPDVDQDGLNDEWEFRNLLTYTLGADDDPDGDSMTNMEEEVAGTDPLVDETAALIRPCLASHALDNTLITLDETIPAMSLIWSQRRYEGSAVINYSAGDGILLQGGFSIASGSLLNAQILPCTISRN